MVHNKHIKRIWLFAPDIFLALLIIVSCERATLDEVRKVETADQVHLSNREEPSSSTSRWDNQIAYYKGKAKQLLERLNLEP